MIRQVVAHRPMAGWRGAALIAAVAALVIVISNAFSALEPVIGSLYASMLFILCGMGVAGFLLNWYVLGFVYVYSGDLLRVSRIYGKRERPMLECRLSAALACGEPDAMRRRFPGARVHRAVKRDCPIKPFTVAYREGGKNALLLMQPEDDLKQAIIRAVKSK